MIPSGVTFTSSVDVGMGSRDGDMTSFVSASFTSGVDSLTLGASSSVGESGHKVGLESAYSGSGDNTSVLGSIHAITAASIMQLTDRRTDRLSVWGAIAEGGIAIGSKIPAVVKWSRNLASAILLSEDAREKAEADAKVAGEKSSSSAATGGDGEDPEGEDPEKKKVQSEWNSWQNLPKETHEGKTYARIGDRLYTQHAVDRLQPSGLGTPAGQIGAGKNISPAYVEEILATGVKRTETAPFVPDRIITRSGDFEVVTEGLEKIVITVKRIS